MTLRKRNPYLTLVNSYLIDSPQPSSISYWWNLGSLLGLCLVIQIASGIFLAMHYSSNIALAFDSVEHIMRDVNAGWLIRYIHANGASFFFICLYLHIGKALYYGSYKAPRTTAWVIGVIIFILTIATAFMGYTKFNNSPKSFYSYSYSYSHFTSHSFLSKRFYNTKANYKQDITNPIDIFNELGINPNIDYWDNLNNSDIRLNILKSLKNKSGIYIIINKITRNCYVGSAITNRLYTRFSNHLINFHGSKLVKKSVNKYGLNNFIFGILEYYPHEVNKYNNIELLSLETSYISLIMPKYNILTEAGNSFGYKHNEESLLKMKLAFTDERKKLLKQLQINRKGLWSEESKNKLKNVALNRPSDYISLKGKINISKGSSHIINILLNNNYLCTFKSINTSSHYLCCSTKTIQRALKLGWIYIPNIFIPLLNNNHINNNNSIIEFINKDNLNKIKIKSCLYNKENYTKCIIKSK